MSDPTWRPPSEAAREKARRRRGSERESSGNPKRRIWEKVERTLRSEWGASSGAASRAGAAAASPAGKAGDWSTEVSRQLYRLACGEPMEAVCFAEMKELFGSYGAGDSDLEELRSTAAHHGPASESAAKLRAVEIGLNRIAERLLEAYGPGLPGFTDRDTSEGGDRERYRVFEEECELLRNRTIQKYADAGKEPPAGIRVRNRAIERAADRLGVHRRTIERAVRERESGGYEDVAS